MEEMNELEADELTLAIAVSSGIWAGLAPTIYQSMMARNPDVDDSSGWAALSKAVAYITAGHLVDLREAVKVRLQCPGCGSSVGCTQDARNKVQETLDVLTRNRVYLDEKDDAIISEVKKWLL